MSEYQYGAKWSPNQRRLAPDLEEAETPWSEDFAKHVFTGESQSSGMTVLRGPVGAPDAFLDVSCSGESASVSFLNEDGYGWLTYYFSVANLSHGLTFVEGGLERVGHMFLTQITRLRFTGELNRRGTPLRLEVLARMHRTDGCTSVSAQHADFNLLGPDYRLPTQDWWIDPEVDVPGDGFWEPVPTFSDWDRWFVIDRPGVKRFD